MLGEAYKGNISQPAPGYVCLPWTDNYNSPNRFNIGDVNGSVEDAMNYCRNPDGDGGGPWCYHDNTWRYCYIPYCGKFQF